MRAKLGSYKNPYLQNNDVIFIGNIFFNNSAEVLLNNSDPFIGELSIYHLINAFN